MYTIELAKARLGFSAAHFIPSHEKCGRLHGHNYRVRLGVRGESDERGMVMDFGVLTREARALCESLDQKLLIPGESPEIQVSEGGDETTIAFGDQEYIIPRSDIMMLPIVATTAECLAGYFFSALERSVPGLAYVEVEESPGSAARFEPG